MRRFPTYGRETPSPQFSQLITMYEQMHTGGYSTRTGEAFEAKKVYPGDALPIFADIIRDEIVKTNSKKLLDYGSGKAGYFKEPTRIVLPDGTSVVQKLQDFLGVDYTTYEPALGDSLPAEKFDCVVNADVLEHVFVGDIPWVVDEMFSRASKFVFANIACYAARAQLPSGEDAHITIRTPEYWRGVFDMVSSRHEGVDYVIACTTGWGRQNAKIFRRVDCESILNTGKFGVP